MKKIMVFLMVACFSLASACSFAENEAKGPNPSPVAVKKASDNAKFKRKENVETKKTVKPSKKGNNGLIIIGDKNKSNKLPKKGDDELIIMNGKEKSNKK